MDGRRKGGRREGVVCLRTLHNPSLIVLRELLKAKLSVSLRNLCHNGGASNAFDEKKETRRGGSLGRAFVAILESHLSSRDSFPFDPLNTSTIIHDTISKSCLKNDLSFFFF